MIYNYISTVNYTLFINGNQVGSLDPEKGLRQGDPLSPYLFIICAKVFSRMINSEQAIQGIKISRNALAISHILFADDILLMCKANQSNANAIATIIESFCVKSGQMVNKDKSHILFSKNTSARTRLTVKCTLSLKDLRNDGICLGNNFIMGKSNVKEIGRLKDRVQSRLEGWKAQLLFRAGKATLIRSVIQAIPIYSFSTFKVHVTLCDSLDSLVSRFWWSNSPKRIGIAWKAWRDLCTAKEQGGLGFKSFKDINSSLFAKLAWKMATRDNVLWEYILRAKYLKGSSFFAYKRKPGDSFVWKGILSACDLVHKGSCFKLNKGWSVDLWNDPWVPSLEDNTLKPKPEASFERIQKVALLINHSNSEASWNLDMLIYLFDEETVNEIRKLKPTHGANEDKLLWTATSSGTFSTRSAYTILNENNTRGATNRVWKKLWKSKIHERLKIFL